jgi:serine/threonine-protein kinase
VLVNTFSSTGNGGVHIWKLPVSSDAGKNPIQPSVFLDSGSFQEADGQFSPDGNWVAYVSTQSQRPEIYVTAFPDPRGKLQVSGDGGSFPRWSVDGKEIFYTDASGKLIVSEVIHKDASLEVGRVHQVVGGIIRERGYKYDVSNDGKRVLAHVVPNALLLPADPRTSSEPLTLISNWPALLRK